MDRVRACVSALYIIAILSLVYQPLVLPLSFSGIITRERVSIEEAYDTLLLSLIALALVGSSIFSLVFLLTVLYAGKLSGKTFYPIHILHPLPRSVGNVLHMKQTVYTMEFVGLLGGILILCRGIGYFNGLPFNTEGYELVPAGLLVSGLSMVYLLLRHRTIHSTNYIMPLAYPALLLLVTYLSPLFIGGSDTVALKMFKLHFIGGIMLSSYVLSIASIALGAIAIGYRNKVYGFQAYYLLALSTILLYLIQTVSIAHLPYIAYPSRAGKLARLNIESMDKLGYQLFAPDYISLLHIVAGTLLVIGWLGLLLGRSFFRRNSITVDNI